MTAVDLKVSGSDPKFAIIEDIVAELATFSQALPRLVQALDGLGGGAEALFKITCVNDDVGAASGACVVRLGLEASESAHRLLAALRAGNRQLDVIGVELDHLARASFATPGTPSQDAPTAKAGDVGAVSA